MPMHHVVLASGAVVVVSVAVATMIAVYESPEFRRYTEDVRRRLAVMFDSVSDSVTPSPYRPPRFNRPEDADGFLLSHRDGNQPGVDADEESCRKQREELLYWNAVRLEKEREREKQSHGWSRMGGGSGSRSSSNGRPDDEKQTTRPGVQHRGSSFDDFLRPDENGEKGSYVFNSGADVNNQAGLRHRGVGPGSSSGGGGVRSVAAPSFGMAMVDERRAEAEIELHGIGEDAARRARIAIPADRFEIMSDIYSATTLDHEERRLAAADLPEAGEPGAFTPTPAPPSSSSHLPAAAAAAAAAAALAATPSTNLSEHPSESSATLNRDLLTFHDAISTPLHDDYYMYTDTNTSNMIPGSTIHHHYHNNNGNSNNSNSNDNVSGDINNDERREVFASIQAWAHDSSRDFYSPLPVTPVAPVSEPELLSEAGLSEDFSEAGGELTPIDTLSLAGSGEDVGELGGLEVPDDMGESRRGGCESAREVLWQHPVEGGRPFDVLSESEEEGMATPASWSEVGSVISESEVFATRS